MHRTATAPQGTCQTLEKSYFRLSSAPDPSVVRPEPVLQRALQRLLHQLRDGTANYFYAADQFKVRHRGSCSPTEPLKAHVPRRRCPCLLCVAHPSARGGGLTRGCRAAVQGLRQDCTVQHLRNELTVQIYEAHARAALQYGDHAEYNQCQTQLNALHAEGLPGSRAEFLAYRLLYQAVHAAQGELVALVSALKLASSEVGRPPSLAVPRVPRPVHRF